MNFTAQCISILFLKNVIKLTLCSVALKLYGEDQRVSGVTDVMVVRSLLDCSAIFKSSKNSLSLNFKRDDNLCELSNSYPEGSAVADDGWTVYARVVDGDWTSWTSGACTAPCGGGTITKTRTCTNPAPSNGGAPCSGQSTKHVSCNEHSCPSGGGAGGGGGGGGGGGAGSNQATWAEAKANCEADGKRLVIINDQAKQNFIESQISELNHWIGLRCNSGQDCTWIDGSRADAGFTAWYPGEPNGADCVWIGHYDTYWDDDNCGGKRGFICE